MYECLSQSDMYGVIEELSRGNEPHSFFLEQKSRCIELIHENILQAGQHLCYFCPQRALPVRLQYLAQKPRNSLDTKQFFTWKMELEVRVEP